MPIRPSERARYPKEWPEISRRIRQDRARNKCEGLPGEDCCAQNGQPHPLTGSRVVLTVAHLNHRPEDCSDENLRALCQRCHNRYDRPHRDKNSAATRRAAKQNRELFEVHT